MGSSGRLITGADILDGTTWEQIGAPASGTGASPVISFTGFPSTLSELLIVFRGNVTRVNGGKRRMNFESSPTTAAYYYNRMYSAGATVGAQESLGGASGAYIYVCAVPAVGLQPTLESVAYIHLPNYSSSLNKTVHVRGSFVTGGLTAQFGNDATSGFFVSGAQLTLLRVVCTAGSWTTTTRAQLLGR